MLIQILMIQLMTFFLFEMMNVLLDTHILIWYSRNDKQLSVDAAKIIKNPNTNV